MLFYLFLVLIVGTVIMLLVFSVTWWHTGLHLKNHPTEGPYDLKDQLRKRNRVWLLIGLIITLFLLVLEALLPLFHGILYEIQKFLVYDFLLQKTTYGVTRFPSGAGISWLVWVTSIISVIIGIILGAYFATKQRKDLSFAIKETLL